MATVTPIRGFNLQRLREGLRPFRLHFFPRLRSTNDHAAELRKRGDLFAPAVVLAGRQLAGRGRGANVWWSGPGSITVTFALAIEQNLSPEQLPLVAGLAVRNVVAELTGNDAIGLKWPNDIVYKGLKIGGLLCERIHRVDLIGLGLNLNVDPANAPSELRRRVGSLRSITGTALDPTNAIIRLAKGLRETLIRRTHDPFAILLREYDRHHVLVGKRVRIQTAGHEALAGTCEGLDSVGRLILRDRRQEHRIVAGHVEEA